LYLLPNSIKIFKLGRMRWAGYIDCMEGMTSAYKILAGKSEEKRLLGGPRHRWGILKHTLSKEGKRT
jgi:hypothetical protein